MKRLIGLAFLGLSIAGFSQEAVVMTVNNEPVTVSEFEEIFWKNKKENVTNKEELDEYIELFTNFRLKVEAAEAAGLDTIMENAYKKAGVELAYMSENDFKAWVEIAKKSSHKKFAEKVKNGQKLIDMALSVK